MIDDSRTSATHAALPLSSEIKTFATSMAVEFTAPWADRSWLQNVLRDVEKDPTLSITNYQVKGMGSKGDSYLSEMQRISIDLQRAGNNDDNMFLIAKNLPAGKEMRKKLSDSSAFPNEIKMFSEILPKLQATLEACAPGKFQPFAARHIFSQDRNPYFLMVSDLAPEGFRMANRHHGLDLDHCLLVMKTLGRFHAASVALHDSDAQLVESFKENLLSEESSYDFMQNMSISTIKALAKVIKTWPDGGKSIANKMLKICDTVVTRFRQHLSPEGNRFNVLTHGDMWLNNTLFKYNTVTGSVEDVRLVDFQMSCYTSCAIDLQYFINSNPRDEIRVSHTEDLLKEYHNELCSTLNLLGFSNRAITFQELLDEYDRKGEYGFLIAILGLPIIMGNSEHTVEMEGFVNGGEQSGSSDDRIISEEYLKILKRMIPVFEQKEYL